MSVKRADWVCVDGFSTVGIVTSVSSDGTTAMVNWGTHKKRMPVDKLLIQTTIPLGNGVTVTDIDRERELSQEETR